MTKNQRSRRFLVFSFFFLIPVFIGVYFLLNKDEPNLYGILIVQSGGIQSEELSVAPYVLRSLDSEDVGRKLEPVEKYAGVYFDEPNEMWAYCGKGYGVIHGGSTSGNTVLEQTTGTIQFRIGIELLDQEENFLQVACQKI